MFQYIYHILFFLLNPQFFTNIEQKNNFKKEFNAAFERKDYRNAVIIFEKIEDVNRLIEPELRLDAAHAYFTLNDTLNARINYEASQDLPNIIEASQAQNQLGILSLMRGDSARSLVYFKSAIEKNRDLEQARFNYELISKLYKPKNGTSNQQQNQPQNREIVASDKKEEEFDQYKSNKISKEKALQLLDDLKNSELKILMSGKNSKQNLEKDW